MSRQVKLNLSYGSCSSPFLSNRWRHTVEMYVKSELANLTSYFDLILIKTSSIVTF